MAVLVAELVVVEAELGDLGLGLLGGTQGFPRKGV